MFFAAAYSSSLFPGSSISSFTGSPKLTTTFVGSNTGSAQGAYFEIRRNGKALDPAAWLAR